MAQPKTSRIVIYIEPTLEEITRLYAQRIKRSTTGYCRDLVIADLRERGLLPDALLAEVTK